MSNLHEQNNSSITHITQNFDEKSPKPSKKCQKAVKSNEHMIKKLHICHFYPCMKKFRSRENLDLHIHNVHLKIKPYHCDYCSKRFSHRNGMYHQLIQGKNYHVRTFHKKTSYYSCSAKGCYKKYLSKSVLKAHEAVKHDCADFM